MRILFLFLLGCVAADSYRPSSGEQIPANQTYKIQWNITGYPTDCDGIEFEIPWMTPPYTSTLAVESPNYETMTSTGYQEIVFTEVNPTSTTTTIVVVYYHLYGEFTYQWTMGPFTVLSHDAPPSTAVTTTEAPSMTSTPTITAVVTVTASTSGDSALTPSPREYTLIIVLTLLSWFITFLVRLIVSYQGRKNINNNIYSAALNSSPVQGTVVVTSTHIVDPGATPTESSTPGMVSKLDQAGPNTVTVICTTITVVVALGVGYWQARSGNLGRVLQNLAHARLAQSL